MTCIPRNLYRSIQNYSKLYFDLFGGTIIYPWWILRWWILRFVPLYTLPLWNSDFVQSPIRFFFFDKCSRFWIISGDHFNGRFFVNVLNQVITYEKVYELQNTTIKNVLSAPLAYLKSFESSHINRRYMFQISEIYGQGWFGRFWTESCKKTEF